MAEVHGDFFEPLAGFDGSKPLPPAVLPPEEEPKKERVRPIEGSPPFRLDLTGPSACWFDVKVTSRRVRLT